MDFVMVSYQNQFRKRNIFQKYLEFFNAWIYRELSIMKEYKINTYSSLISNIFKISSLFIFLYIIESNFEELLNWGRIEIIFFSLFSFSIYYLIGVFSHSNALRKVLLNGKFNVYLIRPVNIFYQHFFLSAKLRRVVSGLVPLIILIFYLIIYSDIIWKRFFIGLIFSLYTGLFNLALYKTFESTAFFLKNNAFIWDNFEQIQDIYRSFPEPIFTGILKNIAIFIPFVYYSSYVTEYVFGYIDLNQLIVLGFYATILTLIFVGVIFVLWPSGLKKYEAYG